MEYTIWNPIRDTVFGGWQEGYEVAGFGVNVAFGASLANDVLTVRNSERLVAGDIGERASLTVQEVEGGSGIRNRQGQSVAATEKTLEMALDPEAYANAIVEKYGINLRGSGQEIIIKYNPDLRPGIYGRTTAANPNVIEIGPDALLSESELANTIAHELNHARDFIRGGVAPEVSAYDAGDALSDYINGGR